MFGELPKLFGREFFIGYFLPALVLSIYASILAHTTDIFSILEIARKLLSQGDEKKIATCLGIVALGIWSIAVILLVTNFQILRSLEGYGAANPARLLRFWSLSIFKDMHKQINEISAQQQLSEEHKIIRRRLRLRLSNEFPERRDLVLPTRFGNIVRAFERYPQIVYNIEAIRLWTRLQATIPESYRALLDSAKATLDFYVNLWAGFVWIGTFLSVRVAMSLVLEQHPTLDLTLLAAGLSFCLAALSAKVAQSAAAQWGELVKGSFDLYRGELCKQLGFELPRSIELEREMWAPICRTMIYRQSRYALDFAKFRPISSKDKI